MNDVVFVHEPSGPGLSSFWGCLFFVRVCEVRGKPLRSSVYAKYLKPRCLHRLPPKAGR